MRLAIWNWIVSPNLTSDNEDYPSPSRADCGVTSVTSRSVSEDGDVDASLMRPNLAECSIWLVKVFNSPNSAAGYEICVVGSAEKIVSIDRWPYWLIHRWFEKQRSCNAGAGRSSTANPNRMATFLTQPETCRVRKHSERQRRYQAP